MTAKKKSENVPKAMLEKYQEIVQLTDQFAREHLNEECAELIRKAVAALCRKRPSPLEKGKAATWACGATHAVGTINFLFDKSRAPYVGVKELYQTFGVAESTGQGKSKQVRELLDMHSFDHRWMLPSKLADHPVIWMVSVNGMIVDIRMMPREVQELALQKGLIPFIPEDQKA